MTDKAKFRLRVIATKEDREARGEIVRRPTQLLLDRTARIVRSGMSSSERALQLRELRVLARDNVVKWAHRVDGNTQTPPARLGHVLDELGCALDALLRCEAQLAHLTSSPRGRGEPGK